MTPQQFEEMEQEFKRLGPEALCLTHYELAEVTEFDDPEAWKKFLSEPKVVKWVDSELKILQETEIKKLVHNINKSNSVGKAQIINSLMKLQEQKETKDSGPIFIYTHVPMNEKEQQAPNTIQLDTNIFED